MLPKSLPPLIGWRSWVAATIYLVVTLIAVLLFAGTMYFGSISTLRNLPLELSYGFRALTDEDGSLVIGQPAPRLSKHGIRAFDKILAINGHPVSSNAFDTTMRRQLARAEPSIEMTFQRAQQPPRTTRLDREGSGWNKTLASSGLPAWLHASLVCLFYLTAAVILIASWLLFWYGSRNSEAMLTAISLSVIAISPNNLFWLYTIIPQYVLLGIQSVGWIGLLIAVAAFPDGKFSNLAARITPLLAVLFSPLVFWSYAEDWFPISRYERSGTFVLLPIIALSVLAIITRYRGTEGQQKAQIKWALAGFLVSMMAVGGWYIIYWTGGLESGFHPVGRTANLVIGIIIYTAFPFGLLVSLLGYRLYDADAALARSVAYSALSLVVLGILAGTEKAAEVLGQRLFSDDTGVLLAGFGGAVAAAAVIPSRSSVRHWAEKRFQKGVVEFRESLPRVLNAMREGASSEQVAGTVVRYCQEKLCAKAAAILIGQQILSEVGTSADNLQRWIADISLPMNKVMDIDNTDRDFPVRVRLSIDGVDPIGWLLIGPRPDGTSLGRDERRVARQVAESIAATIHEVRQRETQEDKTTARLDDLQRRFSLLEKTIVDFISKSSSTTGPTSPSSHL